VIVAVALTLRRHVLEGLSVGAILDALENPVHFPRAESRR